jgi:hypothetical protein
MYNINIGRTRVNRVSETVGFDDKCTECPINNGIILLEERETQNKIKRKLQIVMINSVVTGKPKNLRSRVHA